MNRKTTLFIIIILLIGAIYRLMLSANGHFLFNMDNARDMVDVREMVVLKKFRLIGPTSAIEGLFNGPAWYYLLAIPFVLSGGDPYGSIVLEIIFWAIGGFFLLKMVSRWSKWLILPIGLVWITSDYIGLTTLYAFNPNPVTQLTPLLIYLIFKYLETGKFFYSASAWFLGGLFFNFEMNFGIFVPLIFLLTAWKRKNFWLGSIFFLITLLPQIFFELKHQFFMTNSVINYLRNEPRASFNIFNRFQVITLSFFNTFVPTLMNQKLLSLLILGFSIPVFLKFKKRQWDNLVIVCLAYIFVPFIGYILLPVTVNSWHLGGEMSASIILIAFVLSKLYQFNISGKLVSLIISFSLILFSLQNIFHYFTFDIKNPSMDSSLYKNEITAIDYVYQHANGKNFKVYTYLPSVIDYPYQYLFWWYGKKKYGYIPGEYAYSPNKPPYISNKEKFEGSKSNFSGLVFLIKEPDRIKMRQAWEDDFKNMEFISKEMVGPLEIEIRRETR